MIPELPLSVKTIVIPETSDTLNQVLDRLGNVLGAFKDPQVAEYVVEILKICHQTGNSNPIELRRELSGMQ